MPLLAGPTAAATAPMPVRNACQSHLNVSGMDEACHVSCAMATVPVRSVCKSHLNESCYT